jgi:hypothetical protein
MMGDPGGVADPDAVRVLRLEDMGVVEMHENKYVVAVQVGGLLDGFNLIGPFHEHDEALHWAEAHCGDAAWDVVEVDTPEEAV